MSDPGKSNISTDTDIAVNSRPATIVINLSALAHNLRVIKSEIAPSKVMAVVKANAYGHGISECAKAFEKSGADALATAYVEEGVALRRDGITAPILVMAGLLQGQISTYIEHNLDMVGTSITKLEQINEIGAQLKKKASVHLKIDTGMNRIGQHYYTSEKLFERAVSLPFINIAGVMSHFACADNKDLTFTKLQLERFLEALNFFEKRSLPMPLRHIANSAAAIQLPESRLDMVRSGILLYGVIPGGSNLSKFNLSSKLQPAMELKSKVIHFKVIKKGEGVSYDHTWKAANDTRLVTIPVGYGDGMLRSLSNRGEVIINGHMYPIVGNICMDQLMVNLGPSGEAHNGDDVIILGSDGKSTIRVEELAEKAGTIPYEILTSFNNRIKRIYKS